MRNVHLLTVPAGPAPFPGYPIGAPGSDSDTVSTARDLIQRILTLLANLGELDRGAAAGPGFVPGGRSRAGIRRGAV